MHLGISTIDFSCIDTDKKGKHGWVDQLLWMCKAGENVGF